MCSTLLGEALLEDVMALGTAVVAAVPMDTRAVSVLETETLNGASVSVSMATPAEFLP